MNRGILCCSREVLPCCEPGRPIECTIHHNSFPTKHLPFFWVRRQLALFVQHPTARAPGPAGQIGFVWRICPVLVPPPSCPPDTPARPGLALFRRIALQTPPGPPEIGFVCTTEPGTAGRIGFVCTAARRRPHAAAAGPATPPWLLCLQSAIRNAYGPCRHDSCFRFQIIHHKS
jgi:hypothetical protein